VLDPLLLRFLDFPIPGSTFLGHCEFLRLKPA
jgi:hypothetical protein